MPSVLAAAIPAVVSTAGSVASGIMGSKAASSAADAQVRSYQQAIDSINEAKTESLGYQSPFYEKGVNALETLYDKISAGPGEYFQSPYYNFLVGEGLNTMSREAASKGQLLSGNRLKSATAYAKNQASLDYDKWLSNWYKSLTPWSSLASSGQQAANTSSNITTNASNAISELISGQGNARASGYINQSNAITGAISSGSNALSTLGAFAGNMGSTPNLGSYGYDRALGSYGYGYVPYH